MSKAGSRHSFGVNGRAPAGIARCDFVAVEVGLGSPMLGDAAGEVTGLVVVVVGPAGEDVVDGVDSDEDGADRPPLELQALSTSTAAIAAAASAAAVLCCRIE
jgi:hypothetical protein